MPKITPCLWFDHEAEEAARYYVGIFAAKSRNSRIGKILYYTEAGQDVHGQKVGTVLTVSFTLDGVEFTALNGGAPFNFNERISFQVSCKSQEEVDYFWEKLSAGGDENVQQCGWLKDRYGVSWQVFPAKLMNMLQDKDERRAGRVMKSLLTMKKIDTRKLEEAYA